MLIILIKKIQYKFLILLILLVFPSYLYAQTIKTKQNTIDLIETKLSNIFIVPEIYRTSLAPGFFGIWLYPNPNYQNLELKTFFVKNFDKKDEKSYQKILNFIETFVDFSIITLEEVDYFKDAPNVNLVFLGTKKEGYENFNINSNNNNLDKFTNFIDDKIFHAMIFRDISFSFDKSISNIFPIIFNTQNHKINKILPDINNFVQKGQALFFIGKYDEIKNTTLKIKGYSSQGEFVYNLPLFFNLHNSLEISSQAISQYGFSLNVNNMPWFFDKPIVLLHDILETYYNKKISSDKIWNPNLIKIVQIILILSGLIFIGIAFLYQFLSSRILIKDFQKNIFYYGKLRPLEISKIIEKHLQKSRKSIQHKGEDIWY